MIATRSPRPMPRGRQVVGEAAGPVGELVQAEGLVSAVRVGDADDEALARVPIDTFVADVEGFGRAVEERPERLTRGMALGVGIARVLGQQGHRELGMGRSDGGQGSTERRQGRRQEATGRLVDAGRFAGPRPTDVEAADTVPREEASDAPDGARVLRCKDQHRTSGERRGAEGEPSATSGPATDEHQRAVAVADVPKGALGDPGEGRLAEGVAGVNGPIFGPAAARAPATHRQAQFEAHVQRGPVDPTLAARDDSNMRPASTGTGTAPSGTELRHARHPPPEPEAQQPAAFRSRDYALNARFSAPVTSAIAQRPSATAAESEKKPWIMPA